MLDSNEMPKVRPIVFLDFDDVLAINHIYNSRSVMAFFNGEIAPDAPELWSNVFHAHARDNLRKLHAEFSPRYVVSSSWAIELSREQIREVLTRTDLRFVNENMCEFWCTPRCPGSYRLSEIEGWLDRHVPFMDIPFVILDDVLSGESIQGSHLEEQAVLCDAWIGFTYPNLVAAQKILRSQLS